MRDDTASYVPTGPAAAAAEASCAHLERLFAAPTIADIWALHVAHMARFGFDRLIYGFSRFRHAGMFGHPDDQHVLSNHDPDYLDAYISSGAYRNGFMVRLSATQAGAHSWSIGAEALREGRLNADEVAVAALNRRYGVLAGYAIGFHDTSARAKGGISLCAAPDITQDEVDAIWALFGREIHVANLCMHLRITSLPLDAGRVALTQRQREALEWVGQGKSVVEIALLTALTPATVEKHLRLARAALGVETTAQAVLKASLNHQIFVTPPPDARSR